MDFDIAFDAILELNTKYQDRWDKLISGPHRAFTDHERDAFVNSFDNDYTMFWNDSFEFLSYDEHDIVNRMLNTAAELKMLIYSEMESARE